MMKRIVCFSSVAVLIAMGAATFVERAQGVQYVHAHIYGAWWFVALWAILAISSTIYILKSRERRTAVLLLHASFVVILAGALLTHIYGRSGTIHLRLNEPQNITEIEHCGAVYKHRLNFDVVLTDFRIVEDEEGKERDYCSEFSVADKHYTVSMNSTAQHNGIRFYQMSYDSDCRGVTLMINRDPYGMTVTYCGYALLFITFIYLAFKPKKSKARQGMKGIAATVASCALAAGWCVYYFVLDGSWASIPVLRHPLLIFHVVTIILAYALLLVQAVISAWSLLNPTRHAVSLLRPALCLLAIGIFLGAIWANISWGNYWSWDCKETWALITLMIYAAPLHRRSLKMFNTPWVFHTYLLVAFLTVLMTYFGVNYFLGGMHSYA